MTLMTTTGPAAAMAFAKRRPREPESAWQELLSGAPVLEVRASTPVHTKELLNDAAAAVLEGVVRTFAVSPAGRQLTVRYCHAGDLFGLMTAITGEGITCAEAVTPTVLAVLPAPALRDRAMRNAEFAWSLARELATASVDGVRTLAGMQQRSTLSQVSAHLLEWAAPSREGVTVARANHQQLADATGTAREVVTRALASLREVGIVETRRGAVVINDPPALARVAEGDELQEECRRAT